MYHTVIAAGNSAVHGMRVERSRRTVLSEPLRTSGYRIVHTGRHLTFDMVGAACATLRLSRREGGQPARRMTGSTFRSSAPAVRQITYGWPREILH